MNLRFTVDNYTAIAVKLPAVMTLRTLRKKRGWTQQQLADLARIDQGYISQLELSDDPNPSWHIVRRLAKVFRLKPHEVFDMKDSAGASR